MLTSVVIVLALVMSVALNAFLFLRGRAKPADRVSSSTVLGEIQHVGDLTTVRQNFQTVLEFSDDKKTWWDISVPGTSRSFLLTYSGRISCACDLSAAKVSERFDVNRASITIPHSRVTECSVDIGTVKVYHESAGLFTSLKLADMSPVIKADLDRKRAEMEAPLLKLADMNTVMVLTSMLAGMGLEAKIGFDEQQTSEPVISVVSCEPAADTVSLAVADV